VCRVSTVLAGGKNKASSGRKRLQLADKKTLQSIVFAIQHLSHEEANRRLGGTTALMKAHCSMTLELVARESVQILGGIGITRGKTGTYCRTNPRFELTRPIISGGLGERVERIRRDAKSVAIPGVSGLVRSISCRL
jgi:alkylation response protein AidB-like acyl-CoA dehydrogenase